MTNRHYNKVWDPNIRCVWHMCGLGTKQSHEIEVKKKIEEISRIQKENYAKAMFQFFNNVYREGVEGNPSPGAWSGHGGVSPVGKNFNEEKGYKSWKDIYRVK